MAPAMRPNHQIILFLHIITSVYALCVEWTCQPQDILNNTLAGASRDADLLLCDYGQYLDQNGYVLYTTECAYGTNGTLLEQDGTSQACEREADANVYNYECPLYDLDGNELNALETSDPGYLSCSYGYVRCEYTLITGDITLNGGTCPLTAAC